MWHITEKRVKAEYPHQLRGEISCAGRSRSCQEAPAARSGAAGCKLDPAVWEQGRDWVMEPAVKAARG